MRYLFVVAHPDDEALGAGGTIYNLTKKGNSVSICIMCSEAQARSQKTEEKTFQSQIKKSLNILGCNSVILGKFPNIKFNTIPHLEMVQFIEKAIISTEPDIIVTHYPNDLNNDHQETSKCCQEAIRLFQRRKNIKPIKKFMYMETLSCTDWILSDSFKPNYFYQNN